jgi:iron(III) transport system substrate-binding protein
MHTKNATGSSDHLRRVVWRTPKVGAIAILVAMTTVLAACSSGGSSASTSSTSASAAGVPGGTTLKSLVAAAKAEGSVTLYSTDPQNVVQAEATAFQKQYGITVNFVRLASTQLEERYASEGSTGHIAADVLYVASPDTFATSTAIPMGFAEPISKADLPVLQQGSGYPTKWLVKGIAISQIAPWVIAYNTSVVKSNAVPKSFKDLTNTNSPTIILPDPRAAAPYIQFWELMESSYGSKFVQQYGAKTKLFTSGATAISALGVGEEGVMGPTTSGNALGVSSTGAPVKVVVPALTTGVESGVILTTAAKSPHPAAARLLANWILSKQGSLLLAQENASISVWSSAALPKQYVPPPVVTPAGQAKVLADLGLG